MSNYNFSEEYYPNDDYRETAQLLENYLNNNDTETNNAFGQYLVDSAQYETNGSPASEFAKEARRFVGQSIIDGNFDFDNFRLSGAATTAAIVEFGTDALAAMAIGIAQAISGREHSACTNRRKTVERGRCRPDFGQYKRWFRLGKHR